MFAQSLWSLAAAAFFSMMAACVKYCNDIFGPLELVFYRSLFTTLFVFITVSLRGETLKTQYPILHLRRDVLGFASVAIWFFTLGMLPLGTNIAALFSTEFYFVGALEERTARMAPDRLYSSRLCRHCGRYASVFPERGCGLGTFMPLCRFY